MIPDSVLPPVGSVFEGLSLKGEELFGWLAFLGRSVLGEFSQLKLHILSQSLGCHCVLDKLWRYWLALLSQSLPVLHC